MAALTSTSTGGEPGVLSLPPCRHLLLWRFGDGLAGVKWSLIIVLSCMVVRVFWGYLLAISAALLWEICWPFSGWVGFLIFTRWRFCMISLCPMNSLQIFSPTLSVVSLLCSFAVQKLFHLVKSLGIFLLSGLIHKILQHLVASHDVMLGLRFRRLIHYLPMFIDTDMKRFIVIHRNNSKSILIFLLFPPIVLFNPFGAEWCICKRWEILGSVLAKFSQ